MALTITEEQYAIAKSYADAGDYADGWRYLASVGDNYADNAYVVTTGDASGVVDQGFHILVEKHWANTAGPDVYSEKFDAVARQHFEQYVNTIYENGYGLPNSQQIEQSYRDAVIDNGLPADTAFDGVFTNTVGDLADGLWPGPKENGLDWTDFLGMEDARQVESHVFDNLDKRQAWETLLKDMWDTAKELLNIGLDEAASAWNKMFDDASKAFLKFAFDLGSWINGVENSVSDLFTTAQKYPYLVDPLTLDLNGDGLNTVPLSTPPLLFDLNATGIKTSVGWVAPDDGLLVMDRNGNGTIDSGAELFGNATPSYSTNGKTADGFAALTQEDTNHDGIVDAQDANWSKLEVWQDLNQDGISQSDELHTLDELGIVSLNVGSTRNLETLANGNQVADLGTFTRADGSTGTAGTPVGMADINLAVDTFHRTFSDTIPSTAQTESLPDMQGSGMVRDLREAASLQTEAGQIRAAKLAQYANATTRSEQMALLDDLIAAWGNTSGYADMRTRAHQNGYNFYIAGHITPLDERRLSVLEQFNGRSFYKMPWEDGNSLEQAASNVFAVNDAEYGVGSDNAQLGRQERGQWRIGVVRGLIFREENRLFA